MSLLSLGGGVKICFQHALWVKNAEVLLQVIAGMMHCQLIRRHGREDQQSETALWKQSPYFFVSQANNLASESVEG